VDLSAAQRGRSRIAFSRPAALPGLTVGQFRSDGPLFTCVTDRYATALHFSGRSEWSLRGARWSSGPGTIDVKVPGEVFAEHARQGQRRFQPKPLRAWQRIRRKLSRSLRGGVDRVGGSRTGRTP